MFRTVRTVWTVTFHSLGRRKTGLPHGAHMTALALKALAAANAAGVAVILDGDGLILDPMPSADLVAQLKAVKPDLLRVLAGREAARAIINTAEPPPDCSPPRWEVARRGLKRFIDERVGRPGDAARLDGRGALSPSRPSGAASISAAPRCSSPIAASSRSPRRRSRSRASRDRISSSTARPHGRCASSPKTRRPADVAEAAARLNRRP